MFYKVVWQHVQGVVRLLKTTLLQIYQGIFQWKKIENRSGFDRIMATSLWPHVFGPPCSACRRQRREAVVIAYVMLSALYVI